MPTLVQTTQSRVTGLWGSALIRSADGTMRKLAISDVVRKGDVILTTQDGIVELSPDRDAMALTKSAPDEIDRVIAALNQDDREAVTAAGLTAGDTGEFGPGLRVDRVVEAVTTQGGLQQAPIEGTAAFSVTGNTIAPENQNSLPVNLVPVATPSAFSAVEDATLPISLGGSDADGSIVGITIVSLPPGSTLFLADGITAVLAGQTLTAAQAASLLFKPSADFAGNTSLTFTVTDNGGTVSAPASVVFNVIAVNDAPVAVADRVSIPEDARASGNLLANDTDVDGPALSITGFSVSGIAYGPDSLVSLPGIGTLGVAVNGDYIFMPAANYNGPVPVVSYTVSDGTLSSTSTLTLSVSGVNDEPVAADDLASTPVNTAVTMAVLANDRDADADPLTVTNAVLTTPSQGSVTVNPNGTLTFTPANNVTGPVVITYTVTDPNGGTSTATVTVNVGANTPPTGADTALTLDEDGSRVVQLSDLGFSDIDPGQTLANVRIDSLPAAGMLLLNGTALLAGALISAADVAAGKLVFVPAPNDNGVGYASFGFSVQDSGGAFDTTPNSLSFNVNPINDAPVSAADSAATPEDTPVSGNLLSNDTDIDGDTLSVTQFVVGGSTFAAGSTASLPGVGTLVVNVDGSYTFTPLANYSGPVPVATVTVTDGSVLTTSTLTLSVTAVDDTPVTLADVGSRPEDTPITGDVLVNDSDVDSAVLSVTQFVVGGTTFAAGSTATLAGVGTLVINGNGSYTFTPLADYNGPVPVATYTVSDGSSTSTATLTLSVTAVNDAPVAAADTGTALEDAAATGNVLGNDTDVDGNVLSVTQFSVAGVAGAFAAGQTASIPGVGTLLMLADGSYTFTPAPNYSGAVPLVTYTATDGALTSTATLALAITPVNDAPVAADDLASTNINTPITIAVLANDRDADGNVLTVSNPLLADASQGTVSVDANGALVFTPTNNFSGAVTITYTVTDPGGLTDTATLTVNVGTNNPPTGADRTLTLAEDSAYTLQTADFGFADADLGQTLANIRIDTPPAGGTLLLLGNPVLAGEVISAADVAAGRLVFVPAANANGAAYGNFTFSVQDSGGAFDTTPNTITFDVTPVNDVPAAVADNVNAIEDQPFTGTVAGNDQPSGDGSNVFALVAGSGPSSGTMAFNPDGTFTYTPNANFNGADSFSYKITDVDGDVSTAVVSINVASVNDSPTAVIDTIAAVEDTPFVGSVAGNDILSGDGSNVFARVTSAGPAHGGIVFNSDGSFVYTPDANYNGPDTFTYTLTDGDGDVSTASVTINVASVNDVPTAVADTVAAVEDTPFVGSVAGNDILSGDGGNVFSLVAGSGPANGGIVFNNDGTFTYTPNANYNGPDSFSYSITDGNGDVAQATVTIGVASVNDVPTAVADNVTAVEDTPFVGSVAGNDTLSGDGGNVFSLVAGSGPTNGGIVFNNDGTFTYTPNANYNGPDSFTYSITDGNGDVSTTAVSIGVASVNDVPTSVADNVTAVEDTPFVGSVATNDTLSGDGGNVFSLVGGSGPANGGIVFNANGTFTYTPNANYNGPDSFSYSITDINGDVSTALVTIGVASVNDAPTAVADNVAAVEDTPFVGSVAGNDTLSGDGGNVFSLVAGSGPTNGGIVFNNDGTFTYTPNANYNGPDSFSYSITDGNGDVSTAVVSIGVASVNDVPVAVADNVFAIEDTPFVGSVAVNDTLSGDGGNVFSLVAGSGPTNGGIVFNNDGTFTYTPNANYNGPDSFSYSITDGNGDVSTAVVAIGVASVNDAPTAVADNVTAVEDTPFVGSVAGNDTLSGDGGNVFSLVAGSGPANGGIVFNNNGTFTYTPNANFNGPDSFSYSITDLNGDVSTTVVTIGVASVNDAPVGVADAATLAEDTTVAGNVLTNDTDVDGGALSVTQFSIAGVSGTFVAGSVVAIANVGSLQMNGDGTYTFTPLANYNGDAPVATYTVSDGAASGTGTLTLTVTPVNDAPVASGPASLPAVTEDSLNPAGSTVAALFLPNFSDAADVNNAAQNQLAGVAVRGQFVSAAQGRWQYSTDGGSSWQQFSAISDTNAVSLRTTDLVRFLPAADFNGTPASLSVRLIDNSTAVVGGATINVLIHGGTTPYSDNTVTTSTSVTAVNDAPAGADKTVGLNEDAVYTLARADFGFSDVDGNGFASVLVNAPGAGSLRLNGTAITGATSVTVAQLDAGQLRFTPAANASGTGYASITFQVKDDGGTANGGTNTDPSVNRLTFDVTPVNDTPVNTAPASISAFEDTLTAITGVSVADADETTGPASNRLATVQLSVSNGVLQIALSGGASITAGSNVSGTFTLSGSQADINATLASLQYRGNSNYFGGDSLVVTSRDGLGLTDSDSIPITVAPVNDAPSGADKTVTIDEDASYTLARGDFGYSDFEGSNFASVLVNAPSAGTLRLNGVAITAATVVTVAQLDSGLLRFSPAANANGNGYANFTFQVKDDGGTANGGTDTDPSANRLTFDVTPLNDAPVAVADVAGAVEAGGIGNGTAGTNPAGNVLTNDTDVDSGDSKTVSAISGVGAGTVGGTTAGLFGSLALTATGSYVYTVNNSLAAVQALRNASDTLADTFTYTVRDAAGATSQATLTVTVAGANDAPVATDDIVITNIAAGQDIAISASALTLNDTDVDNATRLNISNSYNAQNGTVAGTAPVIFRDTVGVGVNAQIQAESSVFPGDSETNALNNSIASAYEIARGRFGQVSAADAPYVGNSALPSFKWTGRIDDVSGTAAATDKDFLKVYLRAGEKIVLDIDGADSGRTDIGSDPNAVDMLLQFYNATGTLLAQNDDALPGVGGLGSVKSGYHGNSLDSYLEYTVATAGYYYIEATAFNNNGSGIVQDDGNYQLWISVQPTATAYTATFDYDVSDGALSDSGRVSVTTVQGSTLTGGAANEILLAGAGNDTLNGGGGNDVLMGGAGTDNLTGGAGSDVFKWVLADRGLPNSPPTDTVTDFINAPGGDQLDLRDLLVGENSGNLSNYLHFTTSGGNTTIQISSTGAFSGGFSGLLVDQVVQLTGVNLVGGFSTDAQVISDLLNRGKLITDGP